MSRDSTYAALVRAYRDWTATHDPKALQRIAANKDKLMQQCGGMTAEYVALWELCQSTRGSRRCRCLTFVGGPRLISHSEKRGFHA